MKPSDMSPLGLSCPYHVANRSIHPKVNDFMHCRQLSRGIHTCLYTLVAVRHTRVLSFCGHMFVCLFVCGHAKVFIIVCVCLCRLHGTMKRRKGEEPPKLAALAVGQNMASAIKVYKLGSCEVRLCRLRVVPRLLARMPSRHHYLSLYDQVVESGYLDSVMMGVELGPEESEILRGVSPAVDDLMHIPYTCIPGQAPEAMIAVTDGIHRLCSLLHAVRMNLLPHIYQNPTFGVIHTHAPIRTHTHAPAYTHTHKH